MIRHEEVLDSIRRDSDLAEVLWRLCEFDLSRSDPGEPVRLSSGVALEGIAGDYTGGTFFLCGNGKVRPVLYASSEGQAGLIGNSLTEALEIVVGLPSWWDCLKFSGAGDLAVMRATADHLRDDELRDEPGKDADRATVAQSTGLGVRARLSPVGPPACCGFRHGSRLRADQRGSRVRIPVRPLAAGPKPLLAVIGRFGAAAANAASAPPV
ncbi:hypothetical protein ACIRA2_20210 [Streptomyces griseoviridis]|uniref:hypothetical protein n=1 Tax=Streptomyces griseoviridis TaxID=45398 RepID=UPI0034569DE9